MISLNKLAEWGVGILVTIAVVLGWMLIINLAESLFRHFGW